MSRNSGSRGYLEISAQEWFSGRVLEEASIGTEVTFSLSELTRPELWDSYSLHAIVVQLVRILLAIVATLARITRKEVRGGSYLV